MTESASDLFEMRRLESLSNTVFGVAMTLLAYDLPKSGALPAVPDWTSLYRAYAHQLSGLAMSFLIAGMFWLSHHRRLALAPEARRGVVMLNLLFLMLIVLLPASNALNANYRDNSTVAVIYGLHLTLLAAVNAFLWYLARPPRAADSEFAGALFPVGVILASTAMALFNPVYAQAVMFLAFAGPVVGWWQRRRRMAKAGAVD
jgi:uncharacterized membrane protein